MVNWLLAAGLVGSSECRIITKILVASVTSLHSSFVSTKVYLLYIYFYIHIVLDGALGTNISTRLSCCVSTDFILESRGEVHGYRDRIIKYGVISKMEYMTLLPSRCETLHHTIFLSMGGKIYLV